MPLKVTLPLTVETSVVVAVKNELSEGRAHKIVTLPGEYLILTVFALPSAPMPGMVADAAVTVWELHVAEPLMVFAVAGPYPFQPSVSAIE
jgi:hypothetical protein